MKPNVLFPDSSSMPELTIISGLSVQRQWYLYENIRVHCKSTLAADITCPKPKDPKPGSAAVELETPVTSGRQALTTRQQRNVKSLVAYVSNQATQKGLVKLSYHQNSCIIVI